MLKHMDYKRLGQHIRQLREERGIPRKAVAAKLDISQQALAQLEGGEYRFPLDYLETCARELGVEFLLSLDGEIVAEVRAGSAKNVTLSVPETLSSLVADLRELDDRGFDLLRRLSAVLASLPDSHRDILAAQVTLWETQQRRTARERDSS